MDQEQFWILILHCFLMGINAIEAKQWVETFYKDSTPSETTIKRWFADFKRGNVEFTGSFTYLAKPY
ncbi:hypothetical protein GWI33_021977 [Rhynchophorus ferrugineus]|uniref:Mos1 transposase HTH domain-containing protein n=1 Tax=Rhynchophorus ferrugineus TaxID=354439 RepID=A0A834HQ18_RHYFE|nr:hypothetical protein GWI33_021977 [Rhynchophorus ferrugineus]